MAEALGVAAAVITLVKTTRRVIQYVGEVKDSSHECLKLLVELSMTAGVIDSLGTLLTSNTEEAWLATTSSLNLPRGPLEEFSRLLDLLSSRLEPMTGLRKFGKALTWPLRKDEMKEMIAIIERLKTMFVLALELDNV